MKPSLVVVFGSGEMSPTGRKIQEDVFRQVDLQPPVNIGILETPTGFEVNAIHSWPFRMQQFYEKSMQNFKPNVVRIRAWRNDGENSTNDLANAKKLQGLDYIYCGAGSPSYAAKHLRNSLVYESLRNAHRDGTTLCLGSAAAIALSRFALPVYEIFKAGHDLHWLDGLNFFQQFGLDLTMVPHWNNQEGKDFDTTRCWMGESRFEKLQSTLPKTTTILGIDEQTGVVFNFQGKTLKIVGIGSATIIKNGSEKVISNGKTLSWQEL